MKPVLTRRGLILAALGWAWFSGCRAGLQVIPQPGPTVEKENVARTGYTGQVGAFSVLDNALALARTLSARGLEAYLFPHESGLYRVRFGDFPSRDAAIRGAKQILDEALIQDDFIVSPEDYAVSEKSLFGEENLRKKLAGTAESYMGVEYWWGKT